MSALLLSFFHSFLGSFIFIFVELSRALSLPAQLMIETGDAYLPWCDWVEDLVPCITSSASTSSSSAPVPTTTMAFPSPASCRLASFIFDCLLQEQQTRDAAEKELIILVAAIHAFKEHPRVQLFAKLCRLFPGPVGQRCSSLVLIDLE